MNIFARITKIDAAKREIHGVMAEEAPDKAGEIFDYASSKPHVKAWSDGAVTQTALAGQDISFGNVRSQHNPKIAAGKLVSIDFDDQHKCIPIVARIVDDTEWNKVQEGVYTGFSIGGDYVKRWQDGSHVRYTARPKEVSIVDNPAMYGATFTMVKADGTSEERQFTTSDLLQKILALNELVSTGQARRFDPTDIDGELHKALATPMTGNQVEESQRQSPRFVPQGSPDPIAETTLRKSLANPVTAAQLEKAQKHSPRFVVQEPRQCSSSDPWL